MATKYLDEINRLFDELVRAPWETPHRRGMEARRPQEDTHIEVEIPAHGAAPHEMVVSVEGRRLTITVRRRAVRLANTTTGQVTTGSEQEFRHSYTIPEGASISSLETRSDEERLRVRIGLRRH